MTQPRPDAPGTSRRDFLRTAAKGAVLIPAAGGGLSLLLSSPSVAATPARAARISTISETLETPLGLLLSYVEFYVAKQQGFWAKAGLDVSIQAGTGTASAVQSVLGGSTAYSRASGIDSIAAVVKTQAPVTTVGMALQQSEFYIASLSSKPITSPKQMAGKTVGVVSPQGATQELLEVMLSLAGVATTSVNMPTVGVGGAPYQLATKGKIDAWVALDTDLVALAASGAKLTSFSTDKYAPCPPDNYLVADSLVGTNPEAITRFLEGIVKAMSFASESKNFGKVVAATQKFNPQITAANVQQQLPVIIKDWTANGKKTPVKLYPKEWTAAQAMLKKAKFIPSTVSVDKLINTKFINQVLGA